ncbi:YuzD family protein [Priestia taiwanensis]|uniref:Disulfide oxidoreductase n=1 Tax=Priestia taiwanensis TaxID=1347902 RepID=A0A917AWE5_9BACI|nr:disulfide oxidoreductase YuzD [Priestia taiwanensis]GGE80554.1 disulfide oxidoreductase [Priestia taiwanensis]
MNKIELVVYGAETTCPSCVGMPSSTETFEWLQAAIDRKYEGHAISFVYVDIFNVGNESVERQDFAARVMDEDLFYPVIVVNGTIVGEGNPRLKDVYEEIEKLQN